MNVKSEDQWDDLLRPTIANQGAVKPLILGKLGEQLDEYLDNEALSPSFPAPLENEAFAFLENHESSAGIQARIEEVHNA